MSLTVKAGQYSNMGAMPGSGMTSMRMVPRGMPMGDPGIFGFLGDVGKGLLGGIGGAVGGLLSGGPLGAIGGAVRGATSPFISRDPMPPSLPPLVNPRRGFQQGPTGVRIGGMLPGGSPPYAGLDYGGAQNGAMGPPKGYRLNKTSYFLRDGTFVPAGTKYVKVRRRNPLNPKALDRAMGRITSAKRASKKLSRVTIRKAC